MKFHKKYLQSDLWYIPPEHDGLVTQNHIGALGIAIKGNTCHTINFSQCFHQFFPVWQTFSINDQANHLFLTGKSTSDQYMTHQSFSSFLIVCGNMIFFHKINDNIQNFPVYRKSERTVAIWNNRMRSSCIKAGNNMTFFIRSHRKLCFVSIMVRLIHTNDRFHRDFCKSTDAFQIITHLIFFEF